MPVHLSVKNVPDHVAAGLRARAARNRRSLQRELMIILEEAVIPAGDMTVEEVLEDVRRMKLKTGSESARLIRADRDAR